MSVGSSWRERKRQLWDLIRLNTPNENDEGQAVDTLFLRSESAHEKVRLSKLNGLRFTNRDLSNFGALAHGPFGSVDMVRCKLDNKLYVRKSVEKRVVTRNPSQCYPFHERDILKAATSLNSPWAPHLLCTFQTHTHFCYVMDFAEGGSLGDLLETSGQIPEADLKWWLPQMVVAIHWCHSQGFCHRDIKPSNFVVASNGHLLLIDFASSARLLPPDSEGVQLIPKESCLVLCGTCDYISPEILAMQEDALVALDDEEEIFVPRGEGGYGRETDWWSLGATVYELVYGVAPFFARDIRGTYDLIINHERKLRFPSSSVSPGCVSFIAGLLKTATRRLGRRSVDEVTNHKFLSDVKWSRLHQTVQPSNLQLPQFEYDLPAHSIAEDDDDESFSKGYAFSAFFNSSVSSNGMDPPTTNLAFARPPSPPPQIPEADGAVPAHLVQYIGFTWGPKIDAFDHPLHTPASPPHPSSLQTPLPASKQPLPSTGVHPSVTGVHSAPPQTTGQRPLSAMVTPIRPSSMHGMNHPPSTIRRTAGGTARKAGSTRPVSDAEALRQMGDCVRASARKRLSHHAGRTPGPGSSGAMSSGVKRRASWVRMTLDFENIEHSHGGVGNEKDKGKAGKGSAGAKVAFKPSGGEGSSDEDAGLRIFVKDRVPRPATGHPRRGSSGGSLRGLKAPLGGDMDDYDDQSTGGLLFGTVMQNDDEHTSTTDGVPASPSPSPRPLSAMSRPASSLSRRGNTPFMPSSASISTGGLAMHGNLSSSNVNQHRPLSFHRASASTSSGTQSVPSSAKLPTQEPVSIFKPAPSGSVASRSTSRSVSTPSGQAPIVFRSNSGAVARVLTDEPDADATPKAKLPPSSARLVFMPNVPSLSQERQSRKEELVKDGGRREATDGSAVASGQEHPPAAMADDITRKPSTDPNFAQMEERLRLMMKDIEQAEGGLRSVKARLDN
ncbi:hypothetical protein M408DRAFT_331703 [Serendipita vermifera MAFF 305830]|uniref:non-specific serine/threonine protein kinase n=1 Tax=Serendipita vermifera MAFF 305830 TaxID=933852 RepID=A0A0C2WDR8_SERVB|nr:hypothetical protein M408DRAFT_331703 [Serendipita vermifera MAFF 305830]